MTTSVPVRVTLRYFAAARAAAGVDDEPLTVTAPATLAIVLEAAGRLHGAALQRVFDRCSFLRNSTAVHSTDIVLVDGDAIDVLPPFAGG